MDSDALNKLGTPTNLKQVVYRIIYVPMHRLDTVGVGIIVDFLNQRFGAAILAAGDDAKVVHALEECRQLIVKE